MSSITNQRIDGPFGDIVDVKTPQMDRAAMLLFQQQKEREARLAKENKDLDDEYAKNAANIRDADVPEFNNKYIQWKQGRQELMKMKQGKDNAAYIQKQLEVNKKLADVYVLGNKSKAYKDQEDAIAKDKMLHPDSYADDATELLLSSRKLPVNNLIYKKKAADGKEEVIDLTNIDRYKYTGNKTDWSKVLTKAAGTMNGLGSPMEEATPDGLQRKIKTYKGTNSPADFYNNVIGSITNAGAARGLTQTFKFSPEEAQTIATEYDRLKNTPEFKNAYGDKVDFPASSDLTDATKTAKLLAMDYAIHNQPQEIVSYKDNKAKVIAKNYANKIDFEDNHKFPHAKELAQIYSKIRRADSEYKQNEAYSNLENYRLNQIKNGSKLPSMFGNLGIDTDNTIKLNVSPTDLENFDVETPVVDEYGKPKTDKNGKPLFTKSKAKDIFYNMKTEEYTPVVDGYMGNKFKKDGWLVSYVNGAANTTPKINMLSGGGVKSGGTKEGKKSSASSSKSDRPNLPKSKTKISW